MRSSSAYSRRRRSVTRVRMIGLCPRRGEVSLAGIHEAAFRHGMMFFQHFGCMFQSRTLSRPRPGMGPRNGMIEFGDALVIAVRHILLIPAAARRTGTGRREKAVHRHLGSAAKLLFGGLCGDL